MLSNLFKVPQAASFQSQDVPHQPEPRPRLFAALPPYNLNSQYLVSKKPFAVLSLHFCHFIPLATPWSFFLHWKWFLFWKFIFYFLNSTSRQLPLYLLTPLFSLTSVPPPDTMFPPSSILSHAVKQEQSSKFSTALTISLPPNTPQCTFCIWHCRSLLPCRTPLLAS